MPEPASLLPIVPAIVSVVSALTSICAIALAVYTFRRNQRAASRPILVFRLESGYLWQVRNVGNGAAVTVQIGDKWLNRKDWSTVVTGHALPAGESAPLPWIHEGTDIAAVYTDVFGQAHTTRCINGRNEIQQGNRFPGWEAKWTEWELQLINDKNLLLYTEDDLKGKSAFELDVMRNEFYARQGYRFSREDLLEYFSKQSWYKPVTADQVDVNRRLSEKERNTALFILYYQNRNGLRVKTMVGRASFPIPPIQMPIRAASDHGSSASETPASDHSSDSSTNSDSSTRV